MIDRQLNHQLIDYFRAMPHRTTEEERFLKELKDELTYHNVYSIDSDDYEDLDEDEVESIAQQLSRIVENDVYRKEDIVVNDYLAEREAVKRPRWQSRDEITGDYVSRGIE